MQAHLGLVAVCPSPSCNQLEQFVVAHEVRGCISITETTLIAREASTVSEFLCTWDHRKSSGSRKTKMPAWISGPMTSSFQSDGNSDPPCCTSPKLLVVLLRQGCEMLRVCNSTLVSARVNISV